MRTVISALLALLALVVLAGGLACAWVDRNLVEESGFVALAAPLGQDTDFQAALTASVAEDFSAQSGLPDPIDALVEPLIRDATAAVTASSGYRGAWAEVLRRSHAVTLAHAADPSGPAPALLVLDLAPVADLVADSVGGSLGLEVPVPEDTTLAIGSIERNGVFGGVVDAVQSWPLYLAGAGALALLALIIARRRGTTLALLGLGVVAIGVLGALAVSWVPAAAARLPGTGAAADVFLGGLAHRVGTAVAVDSVPVIVAGLVAVALGMVGQFAVGRGRRA
ncbi:hypothetical protein [Arthrobacter antioxidans]|uniref:hypothetical protein n=1 Tax=Arthrobacter antioxidans TaxID=2895818 RepID=UPI001FFFE5F9|nr:hypothetical protein [Arthrobacter antioxidans]